MVLSLWLCVLILDLHCGDCTIFETKQSSRHWEVHKEQYGLKFNGYEEVRRKEIFDRNLRFINEKNAEGLSFTLGMNLFGHLEDHEVAHFTGHRGFYKTRSAATATPDTIDPGLYNIKPPDEIDWRSYGVVGPAKSQMGCGNCYAFAAVANLESVYAIKTGKFVKLSEQDGTDCNIGSNGCRGGNSRHVFVMAAKRGIATTESYPYEGKKMSCRHNKSRLIYGFRGYKGLPAYNEESMKATLAFKGPTTITFDSSGRDFSFYHSGVYNSTMCRRARNRAHHASTLVGYGTDDKKDYYIGKNSWGAGWGMKGFFKIVRNSNACGLASQPIYPYM